MYKVEVFNTSYREWEDFQVPFNNNEFGTVHEAESFIEEFCNHHGYDLGDFKVSRKERGKKNVPR